MLPVRRCSLSVSSVPAPGPGRCWCTCLTAIAAFIACCTHSSQLVHMPIETEQPIGHTQSVLRVVTAPSLQTATLASPASSLDVSSATATSTFTHLPAACSHSSLQSAGQLLLPADPGLTPPSSSSYVNKHNTNKPIKTRRPALSHAPSVSPSSNQALCLGNLLPTTKRLR